MSTPNTGRVVQVIGPVVDVEFEAGHLPTILNAVHIVDDEKLSTVPIDIITEVAQHLGENRVRCISMKPADGLVRGMKKPIELARNRQLKLSSNASKVLIANSDHCPNDVGSEAPKNTMKINIPNTPRVSN